MPCHRVISESARFIVHLRNVVKRKNAAYGEKIARKNVGIAMGAGEDAGDHRIRRCPRRERVRGRGRAAKPRRSYRLPACPPFPARPTSSEYAFVGTLFRSAQRRSFPRRRGARVLRHSFSRPDEGRRSAGRRKNCRAGEARRAPSHGALASRRSTLAIFRPRFRASVPGIASGEACSELLAARVVVPGGRFPDLPSPRLRAAAAGRQPRSVFRIVSRTRPLIERDDMLLATVSVRSQIKNSFCIWLLYHVCVSDSQLLPRPSRQASTPRKAGTR